MRDAEPAVRSSMLVGMISDAGATTVPSPATAAAGAKYHAVAAPPPPRREPDAPPETPAPTAIPSENGASARLPSTAAS
jgi:hypothetical protein